MLVTGQRIDKRKDAEHSSCFIANVAGTGYSIGDKLIKVLYHDTLTSSVTSLWYNDTTNLVLASAPVMGNLRSCDDKLDVEVTEQIHTDLITGEITPLIQHIVYNGQGVEVSRFYTDMNSSAVYTVTGTVADEPVRISTGTQPLTADDTAAVALTVPAFTAGAYVDIRLGNDIKFTTTNGITPTSGNSGNGHFAGERQSIVLHSAGETQNFNFIAYDNTATAEIFVTFFNTSLESGI